MFQHASSSATVNTFYAVGAFQGPAMGSNPLRILFLAFLLLFSSALFGQEFTGHVVDPSGAAVAKAKITVTNQDTKVIITTVTTRSGDYTVPYLHPGLYTVAAEALGFKQETRTEITLQVGQTAVISFALQVGATTETVTVTSDESLLAGSGDVGEVVENTRVTELPLNGGNVMDFTQLTAGANLQVSPLYIRPFDDPQANLSINGGGVGNNEIMLDGVSNEAAHGDAYNGTNSQIGYQPPAESVGEFKLITNPYDAKYGRASGGVIDMTLKSGTNTLHGSVYEFARRSFLDANSWANDYYGTSKNSQKRDQYGFEVDGPVRIPKFYNGTDKTFFVVQFENWYNSDPSTAITSVPEPQWLKGDFSDLTYYDATSHTYQPSVIYDPLTLHANSSGVLVRNPFPGNIVDPSRINPVAAKILSYYPAPNHAAAAGTNSWVSNYAAPDPLIDKYRNALIKIDQVISSKDRITLRYGYWDRTETQNTSGIPAGPAQSGEFPHGEHSNTAAADWTHTFTANLLLDYRASGIDRVNFANTGPQGFNLTNLGLPGTLSSQLGSFANHFLDTTFPDFQQLGNSGGQETVGASYAMLPTLTWVKNKHTFTFGMDYRILQSSQRFAQGGAGLYTDRTWTQAVYNQGDSQTGNSIASLLLGTASSGNANISSIYFYSQHYYAPFFQDDWKITPRLTLNLGIRYDLNSPPVERHNRIDYAFNTTVVNPVTSQVNTALIPGGVLKGGVTFVGVDGNPRAFYSSTNTDVQPRIGLSFQMDPTTVFHGGFGIMYRNPAPGANTFGFSSSTPYVPSVDGMKTPLQNLSNPYPAIIQPTGASQGLLTQLGQGPFFINPHYRTPQFQTFSAGIEHRFAKYDTLEINYVGTRTYHTDSSDNINHVADTAYANCNILLGGDPNRCNSQTQGYVTNPFQNVAPFLGTNYYSAPTIQALQLTRPFPEYTDITEYQLNNGRSWYNALQVTGEHKFDNNLVAHATWTWSKQMDSGGYTDTVYRIPSRNIDSSDIAHRVTLSGVYYLPVGRGKRFGGQMNRVLDEAIGGWEIGTIYYIQTGTPWTLNGSTYYNGGAFMNRKTSSNIIQGVKPCAGQYVQQSNGTWQLMPTQSSGLPSVCGGAYNFIVVPQYAPSPNVNYTGIRNPGSSDWDVNLSKSFAIVGRLKLQLRLEAFNVVNHPTFATGYDYTPTDPQFGEIVKSQAGQNNVARQVQLGAKFLW